MATPSSIVISVDTSEYCRYESDKNTITVGGYVTGGAPYTSEDIIVELIKARRNRNAVVSTSTISISGNTDPQQFSTTFYLPDIIDQDEISLVRFGKYFVRASSVVDTTVSADSDDFDISLMSVDRFKQEYLFGLDLKATDKLDVKFQPNTVTGVKVSEVPKLHPAGFGTLSYSYTVNNITNATASIGSGSNGTVVITANGTSTSGAFGNNLVVNVLVPTGTSALTSVFTSGVLNVSLDVTSGVPNAGQNTATLIAASVGAVTGFTAVASGTGASSISVASGPTQFSGGVSTVVRLLSWNGGDSVSVNNSGSYVLKSGGPISISGTNYITVKVNTTLLPTFSTAEELLIEKSTITDESLKAFIDDSIAWVENDFLSIHVEPTNLVTDIDPTTIQFSVGVNSSTPLFADSDYDFVVSPLTFFRSTTNDRWLHIDTPYQQILRVDSLFGAYADTRIIDIDISWIAPSATGGSMIQIVPYGQSTSFDFLGLLFSTTLLGTHEVPNFWRFNMMEGFRKCPNDVMELIGRRAAVRSLTILGAALRPGVGSVSHSRDGVSQSISYITGSKYGIYTGPITAHNEWIEKTGKEIRAKYRGLLWAIV